MTKQQPEMPQYSRESDALRRWTFAHSIYQLIHGAPKEWSLRIGIFGRWGEGKTTVLNFIEQMAQRDECPVAKFNPWAVQDRKELWKTLVLAIEDAFKAGNFSKAKIKGKAEKIVQSEVTKKVLDEGLKFAGLGEVAEAIGGVLGPLIQGQLSMQKGDAEHVIRKRLGDRKLIVLVDDLDRANPDLVPHLLLGLREILDLQQCAFVMGFDPVVISKALPAVHAGWGSTPEFLEKIIDFPFWLPPVQSDDLRRLLDEELKSSPVNLDRHALEEVTHLLPTNPRKLKRFLRGLWRFNAQIERHDEADREWMFLLLIELLRGISFKTAERLLANKDLWDELQKSSFVGRMPDRGDRQVIEEEKWAKIMTNIIDEEADKEQQKKELEKAQFFKLMNAMRDLISAEKLSNVRYWARLEDDPPVLTWKEFRNIFQEWRGDPTKASLEKLGKDHAERTETPAEIVLRDLFGMVIAYREQFLAEAADSGTESDLVAAVEMAQVCLSMMSMLISDLRGFAGEPAFLFTNDFMGMFEHFSKWAHFTNHPRYVQARAAEIEVLKRGGREASKRAVDILNDLKPWDPLRGSMVKEAQALRDSVVDELIPGVIEEVRSRFTRNDGVNSMWGHDRHLVEKWILFRRDSGFYSKSGLEFLRSIVGRASTDAIIHSNLLQFVLMIGNASRHGLKVLGPSDVNPLASDKEIMPLVWQGAVSRKIQPRTLGSLKEVRARLVESLGDEQLLLTPDWLDVVG
ncbi:MAG: hypothetical protein H8K06_06640 [Nitrospira sp.]|uniref:KAP NTPase domain-containing protein n=1 Tax=Nitrospira defluvii TaxID=330214 RepID=A0ABM8QUP1_9BACT|nr:P-loop NTPase fold protein [Nitrospira defluvii]MCS6326753.1 hypothetical protein [Nitrospira sp.]CAE6716110.1 hypothetical protein NSPZN2_11457 [Nitrospira defluvii]